MLAPPYPHCVSKLGVSAEAEERQHQPLHRSLLRGPWPCPAATPSVRRASAGWARHLLQACVPESSHLPGDCAVKRDGIMGFLSGSLHAPGQDQFWMVFVHQRLLGFRSMWAQMLQNFPFALPAPRPKPMPATGQHPCEQTVYDTVALNCICDAAGLARIPLAQSVGSQQQAMLHRGHHRLPANVLVQTSTIWSLITGSMPCPGALQRSALFLSGCSAPFFKCFQYLSQLLIHTQRLVTSSTQELRSFRLFKCSLITEQARPACR